MTDIDQDDTETDRRLLLLVGLVVMFACGTTVASLRMLGSGTADFDLQLTATLVFLVTVGTITSVRIRIRSATHGIQWIEVAYLTGLAVAPAPWVILATGLGVGIGCLIRRRAVIKSVFGIAKEVALAGTSGLILAVFGWEFENINSFGELIGPLAAAYLVAVALDEFLTIPVIAIATGTRPAQLFRANWDLRLTGGLVRFLVIICTLLILQVDTRLLLAVPPLVLGLHLAYSARVRTRTEQQAWQRLAQTTDALNVVDLDTVLTTAVTRAAELFSADEVEVELHDPSRLVRGTGGTVSYDGPTALAPAIDGPVISTPLEGHEHVVDIGFLRLRFRGPVTLSERERYTLQTFASALCTAIRNASAYTELARAAEQHAYAATHDALTGLANRRHLLDVGTERLSQKRGPGVTGLLLIDLNHFKEINDTLGHGAGDQVLTQVAERLSAAATVGDLVARLGGDEFAVLFSGLSAPAMAAHRAERLLAALHEPVDLGGMRINVEASGGVAAAPSNGGMAELLRRADVAMYQAKRAGQRMAHYTRYQDTIGLARLTLGGDLRRAVADDEFDVNFQPIVDLGSGDVVAAESLARWQHPDHGVIDPLRFLATADRSELLPVFTEAILDQALVAARLWREAGFDLPVTVNVAPRSLLDARFPGSVLARLRTHDLPSNRLFLELTETLTISQLEVVDEVLGQLRDAGVRLALDGFGSGYSSLSVLSRIPVHELKIDRAFVTAMESSVEAVAVIRSTVDLGRSLDLVVVADGVESEPQRKSLWELGCVAGQGHLFARPMSATRLLAALRRGSGGRAGTLAPPLHGKGAVIRLPQARRTTGRSRSERLPHLPA